MQHLEPPCHRVGVTRSGWERIMTLRPPTRPAHHMVCAAVGHAYLRLFPDKLAGGVHGACKTTGLRCRNHLRFCSRLIPGFRFRLVLGGIHLRSEHSRPTPTARQPPLTPFHIALAPPLLRSVFVSQGAQQALVEVAQPHIICAHRMQLQPPHIWNGGSGAVQASQLNAPPLSWQHPAQLPRRPRPAAQSYGFLVVIAHLLVSKQMMLPIWGGIPVMLATDVPASGFFFLRALLRHVCGCGTWLCSADGRPSYRGGMLVSALVPPVPACFGAKVLYPLA